MRKNDTDFIAIIPKYGVRCTRGKRNEIYRRIVKERRCTSHAICIFIGIDVAKKYDLKQGCHVEVSYNKLNAPQLLIRKSQAEKGYIMRRLKAKNHVDFRFPSHLSDAMNKKYLKITTKVKFEDYKKGKGILITLF